MINQKKSKGLTMMELIIAMAIGVMLLGGAVTMFTNNKRVYKQVNEMGRLQENARFALEMMSRDIRMAGFYGCHHDGNEVNNYINGSTGPVAGDNGAGSLWDHNNGIEGLEGNATNWSPGGHNGAAAIGIPYNTTTANIGTRFTDATVPDGITLRYLSGEYWSVVDDNDPGADSYEGGQDAQYMQAVNQWAIVSTQDDHPNTNDRENNFVPGELLSVTDCASSDMFQLTTQCPSDTSTYAGCTEGNGRIRHELNGGAANVVPGNSGGNFTKVYQEGTKVRRYNAVRYYIGNGGWGGPSLFRQIPVLDADDTTNTDDYTVTIEEQELIEGVENMQLMYGVDADVNGIPEAYYVAGAAQLDDATEWSNVVSVKLALLMRTVDTGFGVDTDNYSMLGQSVNPADLAVRRQVFTTTVQLRNRIAR